MPATVETAQRGESALHDVFLSYQSADRERVGAVCRLLNARGVRAFLDRQDLVAGLPWPQALEEALRSVRAVLVFVGGADGGDSLGLWQRREVWFSLDRQAQKEGQGESFPVIPVLLPGARPDAGFLFLNTWVDLRDAQDEPSAIDAITNAVGGMAARQVKVAAPVAVCPYRALEVFREEHAAFFFGRESFASDLMDRVIHRSLVALVGPSGSGKSSVIQAGLFPMLRRQRPPQPAWDTLVFRPGDRPFHRLSASLIPLLEPDADEVDRLELGRKLGEKLVDSTVRLEDVVDRIIGKSHGTDRLLIVADQFEELFTLAPPAHRQLFASAVLSALDRAPFSFLLSLRADFYGHAVALDRRLSDRIQSGLVNLGPMTRDELRRAVEQPARKVDIRFEAGLVDRVLDHVELQPGGLPLLEFALTQLWERRDGQSITHAAYEAIGEVEGAISRRAEAVFLGLDEQHRRVALSLFTRLLRVAGPNEAEPDTRRRIELDALTESECLVLQPFVDARLLVLGRGETVEKQTVEVAHEALIHGWARLGEWVGQQREFLLWRQRLGQSLNEWSRTGGDKSTLLRGPALKESAAWARERKAELNQREADFIRRSRARERRRRGWLAAAAVFALVIVGAWPALWLATRTNAAYVWGVPLVAPQKFPNVEPSVVAAWIHAMDVAGRLDAIGAAFFNSPPAVSRQIALSRAALIVAYQGRTVEAQRLADRALEVAKEVPDFESSGIAQATMAVMLSDVGRKEAAQPLARRALALGRQQQNPEARAAALADAARALAAAGLKREAMTAIEEARASLPKSASPSSRVALDDFVTDALLRLGEVDEALALVRSSGHSGWQVSPFTVQALVDGGYLDQARELVAGSEDPFPIAVLASALASRGRPDDARALTRTALSLLETKVMGPYLLDKARAQLHKHLLLRVMTPIEAAGLVRDRGNPDELASFASVLADSGHLVLAREIAEDAEGRAEAAATGDARAWMLLKIAAAFARSGDAKRALSVARAIKDRELQAAALGHAACGFASEGDRNTAQVIVREVVEVLPSLRDQQSLVWANVALAQIRLGNYSAVFDEEGPNPNPSDELVVYAAIIRDDALRRNGSLRDRFDRGPTEGLGRFGLHWP